ncbi:MAG: hypothetical protein ACFFB3_08045, partial [Candidatus Hodarchaeota archaeon]
MAYLYQNSRVSILVCFGLFFLIALTGFSVQDLKAKASYDANLAPYEWQISPGDVLTFTFQFSLDGEDLVRVEGYRKPLTVVIRVENVPKFRESYNYDASQIPFPSVSIIEYRLGDSIALAQRLLEKLPILLNAQNSLFYSFPLALPTDFLDWATKLFVNGKTEIEASYEGPLIKTKADFSASYFRYESQWLYSYENEFFSELFEFSRLDGVLNEYETIFTQYLHEIEAEFLGISPGKHVIRERIERVHVQQFGYPHSHTPGFSSFTFFAVLFSFAILLSIALSGIAIKTMIGSIRTDFTTIAVLLTGMVITLTLALIMGGMEGFG